jgi:bisanhydrobacterioruberin hydratase
MILSILLFVAFGIAGAGSVLHNDIVLPEWIPLLALGAMALPLIIHGFHMKRARGLLAFILLGVFAVLFELFAIYTGWPYGEFLYTTALGEKALGAVPWSIFLGWPPIILLSYALANRFFKKSWLIGLFAIIFVLWFDAIIDPGAVVLGYWTWEEPGIWYGIPLSNYLGWIVSGLLGLTIVRSSAPQLILSQKMMYSMVMILAFWTGVVFGAELWLPGIMGIVLIGVFFLGIRQAE